MKQTNYGIQKHLPLPSLFAGIHSKHWSKSSLANDLHTGFCKLFSLIEIEIVSEEEHL